MRSTLLFGLLPLAMAAPFEARAPLHVPRDATGDKYIVKMKEGSPCSLGIDAVKPDADSVLPNLGAFSATLDSEDIETLRAHPDVSLRQTRFEKDDGRGKRSLTGPLHRSPLSKRSRSCPFRL